MGVAVAVVTGGSVGVAVSVGGGMGGEIKLERDLKLGVAVLSVNLNPQCGRVRVHRFAITFVMSPRINYECINTSSNQECTKT